MSAPVAPFAQAFAELRAIVGREREYEFKRWKDRWIDEYGGLASVTPIDGAEAMKRLISGAEAARAGLAVVSPCVLPQSRWVDAPVHRLLAVPCVETTPTCDAFRLWRSLPGYRRACRMLRRGGRRIRSGFERRAWAKGDAAPFRGVDVLPAAETFAGVARADYAEWKAFAERSVYDLGALRRQLDAGMLD